MNGSTPQQQGFALESLIHDALKQYHEFECLREQDIRNKYRDQSMNGVDHWIICRNHSILIQDKWKETCSQSDVTQFLTCADRIKSRCPNMKFTLLWVSKKLPTSHALTTLLERDTLFVTRATSIEDLAQLVVKKVCEKFEINSTTASYTSTRMAPQVQTQQVYTQFSEDPVEEYIPTPSAPPPSSRQPVLPSSRQQSHSWDNNQIGRDTIQNMKRIIRSIQKLFQKWIIEGLHDTKLPVLHQIVANAIPASESDWTNGTFKSIDYFAFAEQIESICRPSPSYSCSENDYRYFVRVCSFSKLLAPLAKSYNEVRQVMLRANSHYGKTIPTFDSHEKVIAYESYTSLLKYCYDYSRD